MFDSLIKHWTLTACSEQIIILKGQEVIFILSSLAVNIIVTLDHSETEVDRYGIKS